MASELLSPSYDTAAPRRRLMDELQDVYRYRDLVRNLVSRNVTARYKRSVLGVAWTLLDPLLTMAIMAIVFTALFERPIPAFPVFILTSLIAWNLFAQASSQAIADLTRNDALFGRVYLPRSVFCVATVGSGLVNVCVSLVPLLILMLILGRPITAAVLFLPVVIVIVALFTVGVGLFMSAFALLFQDVERIYALGLRMLMYMSGIFYTLDQLPEWLGTAVSLNPTYHMVVLFRTPLYDGALPSLLNLGYTSVWAVVAFAVGFWIFARYSDEFVYWS
ncbi:ABC transporter permease [Planctomycetota bacterium]